MSSYPLSGECVHCGHYNKVLTWDHVFPKAWYPDTTSPLLEKWQIPACKPCNQRYGKIEDDLLLHLGLCLEPSDAKSSGITEKVLRALNPDFAKSAKDRRHRLARRQKILRETFRAGEVPQDGFFPHFDKPSDQWREPPVGIRLNADYIDLLTVKIVKGITYIEDGYIIKPPHEVSVHILRDRDAAPIEALLLKLGVMYAREPGIVVMRATAIDEPKTAMYSIEIWGRLKMYASVRDTRIPLQTLIQ